MSITDAARRMAELAAKAADEKSASNIAVIDVSDVLAITELFVIASADNERQVRAIVEEIEDALTAGVLSRSVVRYARKTAGYCWITVSPWCTFSVIRSVNTTDWIACTMIAR